MKRYSIVHIWLTFGVFFALYTEGVAQGIQTFQSVRLYHPTTQGQYISLLPPTAITSYGLTLPAAQGAANSFLLNDGTGLLSWAMTNNLAWSLNGNSGTVDGTNFIGTTDNIPLSMRVNNLRSGYIDPSATQSTFFGYRAGLNTNPASGSGNSAFGHQTLSANISGVSNTAMGVKHDWASQYSYWLPRFAYRNGGKLQCGYW
jgi:hypothetical protein